MCSIISKQFYNFNENPFSFQYLQSISEYSQLEEVMRAGNHIIVASSEDLDYGFSKKFIHEILCGGYEIMLFSKTHSDSLLRKLIKNISDNNNSLYYIDFLRKIENIPIIKNAALNQNVQNEAAIQKEEKKEDLKICINIIKLVPNAAEESSVTHSFSNY